ncbi:MAG TPA: DUF3280 domain-containing protein [Hyphomicrobiaceae bacterium]|nr:DUF3280 domain-containing protein [Hyphomicrobiaceae bacterium]
MPRLLLALVGMLLAGATAAQAGPKVAIFPFELIDNSLEGQYFGVRADEAHRLQLVTDELRKLAARDAGYEVLDLSAIASKLEKSAPLYNCNGCEIELARQAGAEVAITVAVRKFSSMLLSLHIYATDVSNGNLTKMYRVDVRGNTDESWLRGVRRLVAEGLVGKDK